MIVNFSRFDIQKNQNGRITKDKIVWITGAFSGIGESTAVQVANEGGTVILSTRTEPKLTELKANFKIQRTILLYYWILRNLGILKSWLNKSKTVLEELITFCSIRMEVSCNGLKCALKSTVVVYFRRKPTTTFYNLPTLVQLYYPFASIT